MSKLMINFLSVFANIVEDKRFDAKLEEVEQKYFPESRKASAKG